MIKKENKSLYYKNHISFSITKAHWAHFCRENTFSRNYARLRE